MGAAISYKYTNNYSKLHDYRVMTVKIYEDEYTYDIDYFCYYSRDRSCG